MRSRKIRHNARAICYAVVLFIGALYMKTRGMKEILGIARYRVCELLSRERKEERKNCLIAHCCIIFDPIIGGYRVRLREKNRLLFVCMNTQAKEGQKSL